MKVIEHSIPGLLIFEPNLFEDQRGLFSEVFEARRYSKFLGTKIVFVQDNFSHSRINVLRGLHFQKKFPQGKLITCTNGKIFDVVVDLRTRSPTFGDMSTFILDSVARKQLWIPPGLAHGFYVLSASADVYYKTTEFYNVHDESGIIWNDPDLAIEWPCNSPMLSEKDSQWPRLSEIRL